MKLTNLTQSQSISVSKKVISKTKSDTTVVFLDLGEPKSTGDLFSKIEKDESFENTLSAQLRSKESEINLPKKEFTSPITLSLFESSGKKTIYFFVPKEISVFKLHECLRKELASLFKKEFQQKSILFRFTLSREKQEAMLIEAIGFLAESASFKPISFAKKDELRKEFSPEVALVTSTKKAGEELKKGQILGLANTLVRELAELPQNELTPSNYVKLIRERATRQKVKFEHSNKEDLLKMNAGAFGAVIRGSFDNECGIVHLTFSPKNKKAKKVALIGKGVCFDTGGYNIKTGNYMHGMHRDMTGSAVALATFEALTLLRHDLEIHAYLAIAENTIAPDSYKPNEVVTAVDGTTIEVVDTDAEGRMILSDTLAVARKIKPDFAIDFATLTGSAVRAIGTRRAAVFSNDEKLLKKSMDAGNEAGERVWGFPIGDEYREVLKSEIADILQCTNSEPGDHLCAATFLSHFIGDEVPWVHCDLSCEENKGGLGLVSSSVTGFGVRFAVQLIQDLF